MNGDRNISLSTLVVKASEVCQWVATVAASPLPSDIRGSEPLHRDLQLGRNWKLSTDLLQRRPLEHRGLRALVRDQSREGLLTGFDAGWSQDRCANAADGPAKESASFPRSIAAIRSPFIVKT